MRTQRLTFPHRVGETYAAETSAAKARWAFFSGVAADEAILIKTYDTVDDGDTARFSLHAAFRHPAQDAGPPLPERESIEVRCLVLFGDGLQTLASDFLPPSVNPANAKNEKNEQANRCTKEILPPSDEW